MTLNFALSSDRLPFLGPALMPSGGSTVRDLQGFWQLKRCSVAKGASPTMTLHIQALRLATLTFVVERTRDLDMKLFTCAAGGQYRMQDMNVQLNKLLSDAAECRLMGKLTTDIEKRELLARVADYVSILAAEVERAIAKHVAGNGTA
jgi:hypothetical protein